MNFSRGFRKSIFPAQATRGFLFSSANSMNPVGADQNSFRAQKVCRMGTALVDYSSIYASDRLFVCGKCAVTAKYRFFAVGHGQPES
jgi:hypothetical protein